MLQGHGAGLPLSGRCRKDDLAGRGRVRLGSGAQPPTSREKLSDLSRYCATFPASCVGSEKAEKETDHEQ